MPEHVVEEDEPAGADAGEDHFVVGVVAGFISIDENKIDGLIGKLVQVFVGRSKMKGDAILKLGPLPELASDGGVFVADVEAMKVRVVGAVGIVLGQSAGDTNRAVAGEGADLDREFRIACGDEHLHERPLVGRDLHACDIAERAGFRLQVREDGVVRAGVMLFEIVCELVVEGGVFRHGVLGVRVWGLVRHGREALYPSH